MGQYNKIEGNAFGAAFLYLHIASMIIFILYYFLVCLLLYTACHYYNIALWNSCGWQASECFLVQIPCSNQIKLEEVVLHEGTTYSHSYHGRAVCTDHEVLEFTMFAGLIERNKKQTQRNKQSSLTAVKLRWGTTRK